MKKIKLLGTTKVVSWAFFMLFFSINVKAQFNINGQLVQRGEYRSGYGLPIKDGEDPAFFVSQRLRLEAGYKIDIVEFYASIQDVRTWGSAGQLKVTDNYFSLYEGYVRLKATKHISFKFGRQELALDNHRFLGNVDWALQGRSHDFALFEFNKDHHALKVGAGLNQVGESLKGIVYTDPNQYKVAQMVHYNTKVDKFSLGFLFWNDGRQHYTLDSIGQVDTKGVRYSQTIGFSQLKYDWGKTNIMGYYYHQLGRTISNQKINGYNASLNVSHTFKIQHKPEKEHELLLTLGGEIISGTTNRSNSNTTNTFIHYYPTSHIFSGYMDYFYAGGRNVAGVGLIDGYLRTKYTFANKAFISLNTHFFNTYANTYDLGTDERLDNYLGVETDLTLGYVLSPSASLQAGYSHMFGSNTLNYVQTGNMSPMKGVQNWAYLMVIIRPNNNRKFIGLNN